MSSNETLPGLVIADSFPVMQWALQRYLSEECGRQVLAVVGDSDSLVERLADLPPESILITELGLPGQRSRDGIHLVEWLTRHCPQMKVMVYSVFSAPLLAKAVLRSGASAYISKRSPLETLKAALECMAL
ncbi:response regulator transcription factor, partial [Pseudomonas aeruginosa]